MLYDNLQYLVIWHLSSGLMGGRLKEFYPAHGCVCVLGGGGVCA